MIQPNKAMKLLLQQHKISIDDVAVKNAHPIWKKQDHAGRPYWGVSDFWHLDQNGVPASEDLSQMEWDGNEMHLDAYAEEQIPGILFSLRKHATGRKRGELERGEAPLDDLDPTGAKRRHQKKRPPYGWPFLLCLHGMLDTMHPVSVLGCICCRQPEKQAVPTPQRK